MLNRFEMIIQKTSALSMELQDIIAEQWLYDLDNEISWQKTLQQPQDQLSIDRSHRSSVGTIKTAKMLNFIILLLRREL